MRSSLVVCVVAVLGSLAFAPASHGAWPAGGLALTVAPGDQSGLTATSDALGGAFVAWSDFGSPATGQDLYAQRVLDDGTIAPGWPANGAPICTAAGDQTSLVLAADGAGGLYAAWLDARNPTVHVYLQHLDASGGVSIGWPTNGIAVGNLTDAQDEPAIAADVTDGAYVAWSDARAGEALCNVFLLRFTASGAVADGWPVGGLPVSNVVQLRRTPGLATAAAGGVFVAWLERDDEWLYASFVTRFTAEGAIAGGWPGAGLQLTDPAGRAYLYVSAMPDGAGGAIVAWVDPFVIGPDICPMLGYQGQRVDAAGSIAWPLGGSPVGRNAAVLVPDGLGGTIAAEMFSQCGFLSFDELTRVDAAGASVYEGPVCPAAQHGTQHAAGLDSDGMGGAFVAWVDARNGTRTIMAARFTADGAIADGWFDSGSYVTPDEDSVDEPVVVRTHAPAVLGGDPQVHAFVAWTEVRFDDRDVFAQQLVPTEPGPPVLAAVDRRPAIRLAITSVIPNPARGVPRMTYVLPRAATATLELFDVSGRRLSQRPLAATSGSFALPLTEAASLRPGIYVLRLTQGNASTSTRFAVVR